MPHNRFYHPTPFVENQKVVLSLEESKHVRVFRLEKGERCEIVNGQGGLASAEILSPEKKEVEIQILSVTKEVKKNSFLLFVGNMKPAKLDLIVRMGTEIGVDRFFFYDGDFSEKKGLSSSQKERLTQITIAALKQSGRLFLPEVFHLSSLKTISFSSEYTYFYADLNSSSILSKKPVKSACIIGPEKGFSEKEKLFLQNTANMSPISLSSQILRAETASIVASSFFCF